MSVNWAKIKVEKSGGKGGCKGALRIRIGGAATDAAAAANGNAQRRFNSTQATPLKYTRNKHVRSL
jgi:hypothetical protein